MSTEWSSTQIEALIRTEQAPSPGDLRTGLEGRFSLSRCGQKTQANCSDVPPAGGYSARASINGC
jgi:hypothetical protein